jgi:hypothetical protein
MRTRIQVFLATAVLLCTASILVNAQVAGDYGSAGSGNWGTNGANWLVFVSASDWSDATPAPGAPTSSTNVWIRAGHTVNMEASSKACKNLTIQSTGALTTSATGSSLSINGNAQIDGALGTAAAGPVVQFNTSATISGAGSFYFSKLRPNANGITITVDMDINGYTSSGNFINCNNKSPFTLTVNAGRSITLPTGGYISTQSNSSTSDPGTGANVTWNVYGTINAPVTSGGGISLANLPGFTSTLNVYNGGVVNTGRLSAVAAGTADAGAIQVNIQGGGTLNLTGALSNDATKATLTIDGIFDCGSATSTTFGTATVGSTGKLRLMDGSYPSGTVTLNTGSTVEYYGTSGFTMPASPTTYENLQINNAGGITLGGNVTATTLTLTDGALTTGSNTLSIASGGSVVRTSGYVIGTLQKHIAAGSAVGVTYEIGTANGYSPVDILFANVTTAGDLSAAIVPGDNPNIATSGIDQTKSVNEYWMFNGSAAFDTYTATFNFAAADVDGGANTSNFAARAYNGDMWSPLTIGAKTATSTQVAGAYAAGGIFAIGEPVSTNITITASASAGGSITPSGAVVLAYATTQAFAITPTSGNHLDTLLVDEVRVDSTSSYTFINPIADHTIRAVFSHNDFQIVASTGSHGTITPSGTIDVSTGQNKTFYMSGTGGYSVDSVIVDGTKVDSSATYTFVNITANHTIRVTFAPGQYTITASSGANGTIAPSGAVLVNFKANQAFTITPDANYHVDSLLIDNVKVDSTASYTFVNVSADHTIRAVFAIDQFTITASANSGGTITPSGATIVTYGANQAFTITANVHYLLDSVVVDGAKVDSTTGYTFVNVTAAHTIRIVFMPIIMGIRSNGTGGGAWGDVGTWQGGFVPILSDTVTILATDSVVVNGNQSCRILDVLVGGRLFTLPNDTLMVMSPDTASSINGTINNQGLITVSGRLRFGNGAKYQHARNGGSIPLSVWDAGSTCEILGLAGNAPSNGNQNFYNITWNCPSQSSNLNMGWNGNTIGGDITIVNTGGSRWQMCAPSSGTDSAHISTATVTINGNIIQSGGQFSSNGSGNGFTGITINTMGNINVTGGNFSVSRGSQGGTGTTTWNVYGNFSMSNATTQNSNAAGAKFVFAKSGVQSLVLGAGNTLTALPIEVKAGSTLNIDTSVVDGSGIFALDSGATIVTARTDGLNGNLNNSGTITLSPYANFAYDGSAAQVTGALLPADINSLTINNAAGVTLSDTVAIADSLYLTAGKLTLGGNVLTAKGVVGASTAKYVVTDAVGALRIKSVGATEVRFPVGTASAYASLWITNAGTADDMDVSVVPDTVPAMDGGRVKVKWNVAEKTAGGSNCTLKFGWMGSLEDAVFAAGRASNAGIFAFGTDTAEAGTGVYTSQFTSEPYTISRAGITSLGTFAVGKFGTITSVDKIDQVPLVFKLSQNYPNPFNPSTVISYSLPRGSFVDLKIYDVLGNEVRTMVNERQSAGNHTVRFHAGGLPSGVYFCRLVAGGYSETRRLLILR